MSEPIIRIQGLTDVGKKRDHNEDRFYVSEIHNYAVVADGMGGRHFGEVAAQMSVDSIRDRFENYFPESISSLRAVDQTHCSDMVTCLMDDWIRDANFQVWNRGQQEEKYRDMGTTLVMVYTLPNMAVVAHIGDSRGYHINEDGKMSLVTNDHSFVNSQVATGAMTLEEAEASNQKNIITRAIGTHKQVKPDFKTIRMHAGERLLLCSDGLSDMVGAEAIGEIASRDEKGKHILEALVEEANHNGGRDNITVVLVEYS